MGKLGYLLHDGALMLYPKVRFRSFDLIPRRFVYNVSLYLADDNKLMAVIFSRWTRVIFRPRACSRACVCVRVSIIKSAARLVGYYAFVSEIYRESIAARRDIKCDNSPSAGMHFVIRHLIFGREFTSHVFTLSRFESSDFLCIRPSDALRARCASKKRVLHSAICVVVGIIIFPSRFLELPSF